MNTPIDCDDGDACTDDSCVDGVCVNTPIDCDDGDACTTDSCVDGVCVGTPMVCNDGSICTDDSCVDGVCVYTDNGLCTPTITGGGGGGGGGCSFKVDMLDKITRIEVRCCDRTLIRDYLPSDPDDQHFLSLDANTEVVCGDCYDCYGYPQIVVMSLAEEVPPAPDDMAIVAAYDFTGYRHGEVCPSVNFDRPVTVILSYDPDEVPEDTLSLFVAHYNDELGYWEGLPPEVGRVAEVGVITGRTYALSLFAVMAELSPPAPSVQPPPPTPPPAHFNVSGLTIVPSQEVVKLGAPFTFIIRTGESVNITADVVNDGGQEGGYTANLDINGQTRDSKEITLQPEQGQEVSFTVTGNEPGHYVVQIGESTGEFLSTSWINWWLIGGIIAGLLLVGWGIWYRRRRLRA